MCYTFICNLNIRSTSGYNHFIATCFVCLPGDLTLASQNEQIRMCDRDKHDIKQRVLFLLPIQSQLPHIHEKWVAAQRSWFPSVCFNLRASLVYSMSQELATRKNPQRFFSTLLQQFWVRIYKMPYAQYICFWVVIKEIFLEQWLHSHVQINNFPTPRWL